MDLIELMTDEERGVERMEHEEAHRKGMKHIKKVKLKVINTLVDYYYYHYYYYHYYYYHYYYHHYDHKGDDYDT